VCESECVCVCVSVCVCVRVCVRARACLETECRRGDVPNLAAYLPMQTMNQTPYVIIVLYV